MKINLWAKRGQVTISVSGDSNPHTAPVVTMELKDPQITYDEGTNTIKIFETK